MCRNDATDNIAKNKTTGPKIKSICLFGTSADPPTNSSGHIGIVKHLSTLTDQFDEIWVLPVYQHMYKSKRNRLSSFEHRMSMCQLAFQGIDNVYVHNYEKECYEAKCKSANDDNPTRIGTADLLEWLMYDKFKNGVKFTLTLGSDSYLDLSKFKWKRSLDILELTEGRILVISRKSSEENENKENDKILASTVEEMNLEYNASIQIARLDCLSNVSSTLVRNTSDLNVLKDYVAPSILEYIQQHRLYSFAQNNHHDY